MKVFRVITLLFALALTLSACDGSGLVPEDSGETSAQLVQRVSFPSVVNQDKGEKVTVGGKGYEITDILRFSAGESVIETGFIATSNADAVFIIDERLSGNVDYEAKLVRGNLYQVLGTVRFCFDDTPGMISGKVTSGGKGLKDVWVCDGVSWTKTGEDGSYSLESDFKYGYVYVETPSGYAPKTDGAWPLFWQKVSRGASTADFDLDKVSDNEHIVLVSADWQLRGDRNPTDIEQAEPYFTEVKEIAASEKVPVFAVTCGDETWDICWKDHDFTPSAFREWAGKLAVPLYAIMGNHDNDVDGTDDFSCENAFRESFGPTFFSLDRGCVHYVFMDNVVYGPEGRTTTERFTDEQLAWLKTDLSHISTSTPVMFFVHVPMHAWEWSGTKWVAKVRGENYSSALKLLKNYDTVHIFSGHSHFSEIFDCKAEGLSSNTMYEHKVVALGGDIWVSGTTIGYNISRDGVPGGHEIVRINGKDISWRYKGTGKDTDHQMRVYDMSSVKDFWKSSAEVCATVSQYPDLSYENQYGSLPSDAVLINVFRGDPSMNCVDIEASDDSGSLEVESLYIKDPQALVALECWWWFKKRSGLTASYQTNFTQHIYLVVPSKDSKSLTVRLRWPDGGTTEKTYTLPIEFNVEDD